MRQLTFTNLTTNGVLDAKKTELLSYFITCGKPLVVEQLMDRFPRTREATLTKACDTLVNMLYLNVEKRVDVDGVESGLYSLNVPIVKELLRRNNETLDDDLGQQLAAVERILSDSEEEEQASPNIGALSENQDQNVGSLQTSFAEKIETANSADTLNTPVAVPQTNDDTTQKASCADNITSSGGVPNPPAEAEAPAPKKRGRKSKDEVTELLAMSQDEIYNAVRAEAVRILNDRPEKYPQMIGLDPDLCAETFINFYASKGWMVGKRRMVSWTAALRNAMHEPWSSMARNKKYTASDMALRMALEGERRDNVYGAAKPFITPGQSFDGSRIPRTDDDLMRMYGLNPDDYKEDKKPALIEAKAVVTEDEREREHEREREREAMAEMAAAEQDAFEEEEEEENYF